MGARYKPILRNNRKIFKMPPSTVPTGTETPAAPAVNLETWPRGYKTFFMLISTEQEFFLLINVKMPTNVGILTFVSRKNNIPGLSEPEKC